MQHKLNITSLLVFIAISLGITLLFFPGLLLAPDQDKALGLVIITIALLATSFIPEYLTTLLFFLLAMLFHVAPDYIIFAGFQSTALWLVFGGLVVGVAVMSTGLGKRIANKLAVHLEGSYSQLIIGVTLVGVMFAFIMPSAMGRVVLLIPIMLALANHFGFKAGSNGRIGLVLAALLGSSMPAFFILPANVPNMILSGMAESQLGLHVLFGEYLLLHFTILGIAKIGLIIFIILWLYPDKPVVTNTDNDIKTSPISKPEKILAVTLIILLLFWMTDFIHHVSPAWIALGGAIFLLLPYTVVSTEQFNTKINYGSLFFVAGIIGLGSLIKYSGLGSTLGNYFILHLPLSPDTPFFNYMSIAFVSTFLGLFTTLPGIPAIMTPLTAEIAQETGFSIKSVLMLQTLGFSTMFFPYQAPYIVVALSLAKEHMTVILKPLFIIAMVSLLILFPINYLWWQLLGWI
ncbi:SLC13 family permease [Candidatus Albibeggiatoa sp. nov. NOAA]|uniref:SLC13 family permease n=1 Tax=Candidatus Albibeggiatoa sp. nov. NOAA TaxID=3162724 RepID=UPI0032F8C6B2|nr:anion permease [Thiotrichaceae bacterium]